VRFDKLLGAIFMIAGGILAIAVWRFVLTQEGWIPGLLVLALGAFLFPLGREFFNHGRKREIKERSTPEESDTPSRGATQTLTRSDVEQELDDGQFVLYLRSFDDESITAEPVGRFDYHSLEESIVAAFKRIGSIEAIGRPGEPLPELGARRWYLPMDAWQSVVERLMQSARLVLIFIGRADGAGLRWEVNTALRKISRRRLVFFVPKNFADVFLDSHEFLRGSKGTYRKHMNTLAYLIYFDISTGKPVVYEIRDLPMLHWRRRWLNAQVPIIENALRPICDQLGVVWQRPPITGFGVFALLLGLSFSLGPVVLGAMIVGVNLAPGLLFIGAGLLIGFLLLT
jgi:hypothetical protein